MPNDIDRIDKRLSAHDRLHQSSASAWSGLEGRLSNMEARMKVLERWQAEHLPHPTEDPKPTKFQPGDIVRRVATDNTWNSGEIITKAGLVYEVESVVVGGGSGGDNLYIKGTPSHLGNNPQYFELVYRPC